MEPMMTPALVPLAARFRPLTAVLLCLAGRPARLAGMSSRFAVLIAVFVAPTARAQTTAAAPWLVWPPAAEQCRSDTGDARAVLGRAGRILGLDSAQAHVLRMHSHEIVQHNFESDRPYRPFLMDVADHVSWLNVTNGVERDSVTRDLGQRGSAVRVEIGDDRATFVRQDATWRQNDRAWVNAERYRALDPRIVVRAWIAANDVRVAGRCVYRDYERTVLTRSGLYGVERLYVDPKTGYIVKLDRQEPNSLWGQVHVEFVYATWQLFGTAAMPAISSRLLDGDEEVARNVSTAEWGPSDSDSALALPGTPTTPALASPSELLRPALPDTQRLGPHTYLLANAGHGEGHNEVVTLVRDTVYVLDATESQARARADSSWIGRLFPGRHPIVVIVTDLVWPHVAGVRFWVASGATIMSGVQSAPFLRAVVARQWMGNPDKLELLPHRPALRFVPVREPLSRAGIAAYPIDGIGTEGTLMVWLPEDSLLWAGDNVQQLNIPSLNTNEVYAAACRAELTPTRVVAQHQPTALWSKLAAVVATPCRH